MSFTSQEKSFALAAHRFVHTTVCLFQSFPNVPIPNVLNALNALHPEPIMPLTSGPNLELLQAPSVHCVWLPL
jgi:hypothetical protein